MPKEITSVNREQFQQVYNSLHMRSRSNLKKKSCQTLFTHYFFGLKRWLKLIVIDGWTSELHDLTDG